MWGDFWQNGAFIDLGASSDPRWKELERRIITSQYLMRINCAGLLPPQESGLRENSWYGRFHLEMIWWHSYHWLLWERPQMAENMWNKFNWEHPARIITTIKSSVAKNFAGQYAKPQFFY